MLGGCEAARPAVHVEEGHSPKRPYLSTRFQQQCDVIEHRKHDDTGLALLLLRDRLTHERGGALAADNIVLAEWRVDIVALPPLLDQRIESLGQRIGAWVVVKVEFGIELAV